VYVASFVEAGSGSAVFNVQGLLQQVRQQHPKPLLLSRLYSLLLPTFTWCSLTALEAATPSPVSPLITQTAAPGQRFLLLQCFR
jgi:hypothetical protein